MTTLKLTPRQQDVLDAINAGAIAHYMPYLGRFSPEPYWFLSTTMKRVTKQIERLIALNLVQVIQESAFSDKKAVARTEPQP